jgi:outer membrane protein OmpA-like peptidoglycan-associated protein
LQDELSYQDKALDILRTRLTRQDTVREIAALHIDKLKTYWKKQEADIADQLLFCNQAVRRAESQRLNNEITLVMRQVPKSMAFDEQLEKINTSEKKMISDVSAGDFFAADEKAEEIKGWISKLKQEISAPPPPSTFANILLAGGVFHQFGRKPIASFGDDVFLYNETFMNQMPLLAEIITRYPGYHVFVDGHIDPAPNNGNSYVNTSLSRQRVLEAAKQIRAYGIPEDKLTLDWFGEFHNLVSGRPASPELRKNNRVDLVIMNASDTASFAEKYVRFKNQFRISLPNGQSKTFYHKNGFWIEKGYDELAHPLLAIYYAGQAYQTMRSRHDVFRVLTEEKPSPLFSGGKTYLGNQFRASFEIAGEIFNVEISEFGVKSVADIHQSNVRQFLGAASSAKP